MNHDSIMYGRLIIINANATRYRFFDTGVSQYIYMYVLYYII